MLYIAILAIVLPAFTIFISHIWQQESGRNAQVRLEQTASLLFLELSHSLTEADAILTNTSTLGTDASIFSFKDANGTTVTIDLVPTTVAYASGDQTVNRLRLTRGSEAAVWLTEPEHNVATWRVDAVRNDAAVLTGVNIGFSIQSLNNTNNPYREAAFTATTTFALSPHALEQ